MVNGNTTAKNAVEKVSANIINSVVIAENAEDLPSVNMGGIARNAKTAEVVRYVYMVVNVHNAKTAVGHQSANTVDNVYAAKNAAGHPSVNTVNINHVVLSAVEVKSANTVREKNIAKIVEVHPSASMVVRNKPVKNVMDHPSANIKDIVLPASNAVVVVRVKAISSQIADTSSVTLANYDWVWDKPFYVSFDGGCCNSKRRIDLWCIIGNVLFAIEIDENQHKDRAENYEETRYNDLAMDFTGRQIFLRINPDSFVVNNVKFDPIFEERLNIVENKIAELLELIDVEVDEDSFTFVQVHHLFYDE